MASTFRAFRLIQISDCHLPASPDKPYRGLRADSGLEAVIAKLADWRADAILVTGDLSEDASASSYQRLANRLASLNLPVFALPGNHDLPMLMQQYFPQGPYQGACHLPLAGWQLLLLDSSRPGRIDGSIEVHQLEQLEHHLQNDVPALLALHHHPLEVGSPWIDKHRLDQPERLLDFVASHPEIKAVLWGHVHQAFEARTGSTRFMSSPSTAANSLPGKERFTQDPAGPACRWLELHADGILETGILVAA
jgi:Icc protein